MSRHFLSYILILSVGTLLLNPNKILAQDDRKTWQPPAQIMDSVGVKPGMIIGEVGAGRGFFTFHLAERVGEKGKVYANDISRYALDKLEARAENENIENITIVMGDEIDPLFPQKNLDMIIMVYVLHHFEKPYKMLENIKKYMKPEATMVIIEKDTKKDRDAYPHFMSKKQVLETLQESKYTLERIETFLEKDTIFIYRLRE